MKEIILLAHGSRDEAWLQPFKALLARVREQGATNVHLAFMELAEPSLETVVRSLGREVQALDIMPLFFAAGRHLRVDVPKQVQALNEEFPDCVIKLLPPVGEQASFIDLLTGLICQHANRAAQEK